MKQTYIFCLLFVSLFSSAQIINIPDANFKTKLLAASTSNTIAKDLSGNYFKIDSNNNGQIEQNEALNVKELNISLSNITNLTGIEFFINLTALFCIDNQLTSINITQNTALTRLECNNNQLTSLDISQNLSLQFLNCSFNELTSLDISQNNILDNVDYSYNPQLGNVDFTSNTNLTYLNCSATSIVSLDISQNLNLITLHCYLNQLTSLDVSQNNNLQVLFCGDNPLTALDITQNTNLIGLDCSNVQFTSLDVSQNFNLQSLGCSYNQFTTLDVSQNLALELLHCYNCLLTSLDVSQNYNLQDLDCSNNQLTNLDISQNTELVYFFCSNNQLTTLDATQNQLLEWFECNNNLLETLYIKNGNPDYIIFSNNPNLQYICADDEDINFVQQQLDVLGYTFTCHVNDYCTFIPGGTAYEINGNTKLDTNNNGCDIADINFPYLNLSVTDGIVTGNYMANTTGDYNFSVRAGNYTITPILENPSYFSVSPANAVINFPTQTSLFTQDFCVTPNGIKHDVEVSIIPTTVAFPGVNSTYKVIYKNKGNQIENGVVNLQFNDAVLDLVSSNPTFTTQTVNNLSFNYTNLNPFESREISIILNVNSPMETPAVVGGDILNYTVINSIINTDEIPSDNTFVLNQTVVNSYDPNDKTCLQGNYVGPDKIGQYVHYMIRFENTGTFPAENIVVKDMIDTSKFDVASLVPLNASHNYVTKITDNKVEFIFENINLPFDDANNDGYIAFKIKTSPTLVLGNTFSNSANIYFDYNFPIVTNTATTTIAALNNPSFEFANYFSLYPNPTTNELNINLKSAIEINSIQIYNTIGQLVTVQTGNSLKVDVSNLKTGNYFIKINTTEGFSTSQFIKE